MKLTSAPRWPAQKTRGFTLVEILVTSGIMGIFTIAALTLFLQSLNIFYYDTGKLLVNRDIRRFTNEMTENATFANYFQIFRSFSARTRTETVTDPESNVETNVTVVDSVNDGQSGDFLLLVYQDPTDSSRINRLVGYYRSPADPNSETSDGPVRRFDITISPSSNAAIWTLLPSVESAGSFPEVIELSRGLADGKLFYNFFDRSVMVKGQIFHDGSLYRRATNTYNFTVSPRG